MASLAARSAGDYTFGSPESLWVVPAAAPVSPPLEGFPPGGFHPEGFTLSFPPLLIRRWRLLFWAFVAFPPRSISHQCFSSLDGCASAPSSTPSPTISTSGPAGRPSTSSLGLIDPLILPRLWRSPRRDPRLFCFTCSADYTPLWLWGNFFLPFPRVACAATPFPCPCVSPATWSHPCVSAPTAAAGISADPARTIAPPSTGPTSAFTAASDVTAVCACGAGTVTSVASAARSCSSTRPCISGSSVTAGPVTRGEAESPPEAAAVPAANSPSASHPVAAPPDVAASAASVIAFTRPTQSSPSAVSGGDLVIEYRPARRDRPDSPPVGRALRVEQRVGHVGTCLTLLPMVLDQFHAYQLRQACLEEGYLAMLQQEQEEAVAAAMEMLRMLPAIGLVPGSPGSELGPGPASLRRLALAALQSPRDIVPAAASVLRWMDGRLCWILAE
ncbi:unnamed protein product [Closterium sp. NIES-53]